MDRPETILEGPGTTKALADAMRASKQPRVGSAPCMVQKYVVTTEDVASGKGNRCFTSKVLGSMWWEREPRPHKRGVLDGLLCMYRHSRGL